MPLTSSAARRSLASHTWGTVQTATRLSRGASVYHSAGHGGIVAELPTVPDSPVWRELREALYRELFVEEVHRVQVRGRRRYLSAREWNIRGSEQSWELLVGEEDCTWSIVVLVLDALAQPLDLNAGHASKLPHSERIEQARSTAERWYPALLDLLDRAVVDAKAAA